MHDERTLSPRPDRLPTEPAETEAKREVRALPIEVGRLRAEIRILHEAIHGGEAGRSFHDLVGAWLGEAVEGPEIEGVDLGALERHEREVEAIVERAAAAGWSRSPWREAIGLAPERHGALSASAWRDRLEGLLAAAKEVDRREADAALPFAAAGDLREEAGRREAVAARIEAALELASPDAIADRAAAPQAVREASAALEVCAGEVEAIRQGPLDPELARLAGEEDPELLGQQEEQLRSWLAASERWYGPLLVGRARAAGRILQRYGLPAERAEGERLAAFLHGLRARRVVQRICQRHLGLATEGALPADAELLERVERHRRIAAVLAAVDEGAADGSQRLRRLLADPKGAAARLRRSRDRAEAIAAFEEALVGAELFDPAWIEGLAAEVRAGGEAVPRIERLVERAGEIGESVRIRHLLDGLPDALRGAVERVLAVGCDRAAALSALRRSALAREIRERMARLPPLAQFDGARLQASLQRLRRLLDEDGRLGGGGVDEAAEASGAGRVSPVAIALAARLRARGLDVDLGGDDAPDLIVQLPGGADEAIGILVDFAPSGPGGDPVERDLRRTRLLRERGWRLLRLWSPTLFRDPDAALAPLAVALRRRSS